MSTETLYEARQPLYKREAVIELSRNFIWQSIVNLIPHSGFQPSVEWVKSKLPWISFEEAGTTLDLLKSSGFLTQKDDGKWQEVCINFENYLTDSEMLESQFIISGEVSGMTQDSSLANIYQTFILSNEESFIEWANKVNAATEEFLHKSEAMKSSERNSLYAVAINGLDATSLGKGAK
ncbi:MAG: hypothetical protein ACXVCP_08450 [Bdellovibrio sp.]